MRKSSPIRLHTDNYNNINLCLINSGPRSNSSRVRDLSEQFFTVVLQDGENTDEVWIKIMPEQVRTVSFLMN